MVEYREVFKTILDQENYRDIITSIKGPVQFLQVDYNELKELNPEAGDKLLSEGGINDINTMFFSGFKDLYPDRTVKNIRYKNIPELPLKEVKNSEYVGKLVTTEGIVRIAGDLTPRPYKVVYECSCLNYDTTVEVEKTLNLTLPGPCPECTKQDYHILGTEYLNRQWVKIQEVGGSQGTQPVQLKAVLEDDLTRLGVQPGDLLKLTGTIEVMAEGTGAKKRYQFFLDVNNIQVEDKRFEEIRITPEEEEEIKTLSQEPDLEEKIYKSIAPRISGFEIEKKAIALQLFGGTSEEEEDGVWVRGDIHILLVGDPGIGKSHILKHISNNLAPRGIYTTGGGSSGVGLTASVRKDSDFSGEYIVEAGAMVLGDNGIVCIDEFDKLGEEDRGAIHEALADQTVTIAKAGNLVTLNSRCTVLAGANTKFDRVDRTIPVKRQLNLPSSIIDRFDLLFLLEDFPQEEKDRKIARVITREEERKKSYEDGIKPELLKKYIAYARGCCDPQLTIEASIRVEDHYVQTRSGKDSEDPIPITPRFVHAIKKLGQARARMSLRKTVTVEDIEEGISIVSYYLQTVGMDPLTGKIDIDLVEGRTPASEKTLKHIINLVIKWNEEEYGEGISWWKTEEMREDTIQMVRDEGKKKGLMITKELAEEEILKAIEDMI